MEFLKYLNKKWSISTREKRWDTADSSNIENRGNVSNQGLSGIFPIKDMAKKLREKGKSLSTWKNNTLKAKVKPFT